MYYENVKPFLKGLNVTPLGTSFDLPLWSLRNQRHMSCYVKSAEKTENYFEFMIAGIHSSRDVSTPSDANAEWCPKSLETMIQIRFPSSFSFTLKRSF